MSQHITLVSQDGLKTADICINNEGILTTKIAGEEFYINLTPV